MNRKIMKLSDISPAEYNPRIRLTEKDFQYKALKSSIDEFGLVVPLIVNERTGTLISGHQRLNIMLAESVEETEVIVVDFPPEKERALCIAMNKIDGEWDYGKLADLISELQESGTDIIATGFTDSEIKELLGEIEAEIDSNDDVSTDDDGITILIGEYKFQMDRNQYDDVIADIRERVGFANTAVTNELKRRLLV